MALEISNATKSFGRFPALKGVSLAARTVFWLWKTGNPSHGAVPLAMVIIAGTIHAVFEDWLFAAGYYLCVFYWSMAFVFVDQAMSLPVPSSQSMFWWNAREMRQDLSVATPVR